MLLSASLAVGEVALSLVLKGERDCPRSPASPKWVHRAAQPDSEPSLAPPTPHVPAPSRHALP